MSLLDKLKAKAQAIAAGPDKQPPLYTLNVSIFEGRNLVKKDMSSQVDPYIIANVHQEGRSILWNGIQRSTKIHYNTINPQFNETFLLPVRKPSLESLHIRVYDKDQYGLYDRLIGEVYVPLADIPIGTAIDRWYDLVPPRGGAVHLVLWLTPGWSDVAAASALNSNQINAKGQMAGSYPATSAPSAYPPPAYPSTAYPPPAYPPPAYPPPAQPAVSPYPVASYPGSGAVQPAANPFETSAPAFSSASVNPQTGYDSSQSVQSVPQGAKVDPALANPVTAPAYSQAT